MVKKEKIIEKLKKLLKDNDVENPNFETASFFKKGIEEIIEQDVKQDSKKGEPSISMTPSGYLNASSIKLPEFIKKGLREIEEEKEEQEDKPNTIEEAYKFCIYLENICKESLSPNEPCNEECKKELHQLKEKLDDELLKNCKFCAQFKYRGYYNYRDDYKLAMHCKLKKVDINGTISTAKDCLEYNKTTLLHIRTKKLETEKACKEQEQKDITEFLKGLERLNNYAGLKWHVPKEEVKELIEYWKKKNI